MSGLIQKSISDSQLVLKLREEDAKVESGLDTPKSVFSTPNDGHLVTGKRWYTVTYSEDLDISGPTVVWQNVDLEKIWHLELKIYAILKTLETCEIKSFLKVDLGLDVDPQVLHNFLTAIIRSDFQTVIELLEEILDDYDPSYQKPVNN